MRKILCAILLVCAVASCAWADVQIDAENFPDDVFREYIRGNFDVDSNGVLDGSEIEDVISLDVRDKGITSLAGIKYLTSLEILLCSNNDITQLDFSGCTSLKRLSCGSNALENLDIQGCSGLEYLECGRNNLTSLNVRDCINLKWLYCYRNELEEIDVSRNPKLRLLSCHHNNITDLDLSENISLLTLHCQYNGLSVLNLSDNTLLWKLDCRNNCLKRLDLSRNVNLSRLFTELSQNMGGLKFHESGDGKYYTDLKNDYGIKDAELSRISGVAGYNMWHLENVLAGYDPVSGVVSFAEEPVTLSYIYNAGNEISMNVSINVYTTITTEEIDEAYRNRKYSFTLQAIASEQVKWSLKDPQEFPAGLSLSRSGKISGTPEAEGSYWFTVIAESQSGGATEKYLHLRVLSPSESPESPVITTISQDIPIGYAGVKYNSFKFTSSVSSGVTWSMDAEIPGLTLSESGRLSGTPSATGIFPVAVTVEDRKGGMDSQQFVITILDSSQMEGRPVVITRQEEIPLGYVGTSYKFQFAVSGDVAKWIISSGDIPGLSITKKGILSGRPEREGNFTFTVRATNSSGGTGDRTYVLEVKSAPYTPEDPVTPTPSNPSGGGSGGGGCGSVSGMIMGIGLCVMHGLSIKRRN